MNKCAIVIGATGLVGSHLVDQLAAAEHIQRIVTLTRRPAPHSSAKVHNSVVDFDQLGDYSELFVGDMLFLCLGTTLKQAGSISAQRVVDLDYQLQAAQIAAQQSVSELFLVSSSGANSRSSSPYLKMKGELEDAVHELRFKRISIFQPSLLLGERSEARLAEGIGAKVLPIICKLPGLQRYRPISAKLVAQKMSQQSAAAHTGSQIFSLEEVFP